MDDETRIEPGHYWYRVDSGEPGICLVSGQHVYSFLRYEPITIARFLSCGHFELGPRIEPPK